jgi:hypothetical protein
LNNPITRCLLEHEHNVKKYKEAISNSLILFDCIASTTNKKYVVDSTKNPIRLKALYKMRPKFIKVIYLVRDGRAVVASGKRRNNETIEKNSKIWVRANQNTQYVLKSIPEKQILNLRYEDLCDNLTSIVDSVFSFIGVDTVKIGELKLDNYHGIPGNPWLYKSKKMIRIKKDVRWKNELTNNDLTIFNKIAGKMNDNFGYE